MTAEQLALDPATLTSLRAREIQAPRYTSYPTALQMQDVFDKQLVLQELSRTNEEPIPSDLSLYVHIPFCASACYYCGCNRTISCSKSRQQEYLKALICEIQALARRVRNDRSVRQIHFGGGTPNLLKPAHLHGLMARLHEHFQIDEACEVGLEIDPRQARVEDVQAWFDAGFNRLSIGVQDLDAHVQTAINRQQSSQHIENLLRAAAKVGFSGVNLDLIIGLPHQNGVRFQQTLDQLLRWRPQRIALYQYAHMPDRFPAQRAIRGDDLPSLQQRFELQDAARQAFTGAGYQHIGLDHFALPDDALAQAQTNGRLRRNFQGYTVMGDCDVLAFGVSAISQIGRVMAQNSRDLRHYEQEVTAGRFAWQRGLVRTGDDERRASIIEEIMCHGHTEHADPLQYPDAWQALQRLDPDQRWVKRGESHWTMTAAGHDFRRLIAQCFDTSAPHGVRHAGQPNPANERAVYLPAIADENGCLLRPDGAAGPQP